MRAPTNATPLVFILFCTFLSANLLFSKKISAYPDRPIELIVPSLPGSSADIIARILAQNADHSITVINMPGGNGSAAYARLANARPDGSTLAIITPYLLINEWSGITNFSADSFTLVGMLSANPLFVYTSNVHSFDSADHFFEQLRSKNAQIHVSATDSIAQISLITLLENAGLDTESIMFKELRPEEAIQYLADGALDILVASQPFDAQDLHGYRPYNIMIMSGRPDERIPEVPTSDQIFGLNWNFNWFGVAGPKGMSTERVFDLEGILESLIQDEVFQNQMIAHRINPLWMNQSEFEVQLRLNKEQLPPKDHSPFFCFFPIIGC